MPVAGAETVLKDAGVADRCTAEGGSFLERVPDGGDAYVMKNISTTGTTRRRWRSCATSAPRSHRTASCRCSRWCCRSAPLRSSGINSTWRLLVTVGGRERTHTDYAKLLSRAGFRLDRVIETVTPLPIAEASPV